MFFVCHPKILHKHCLQFLLGVKMAPRETKNNAYAKFWCDKQRALWYVIVFSGVVNYIFHFKQTFNLFFLFLNLSAVPKKSTPGRFAFIWYFSKLE